MDDDPPAMTVHITDSDAVLTNTPWSSKVMNNLNKLRHEKLFCDVLLMIPRDPSKPTEDAKISVPAHACVLAASCGLFKDILSKDVVQRCVVLKSFDEPTLQACLDYIYGKEIRIPFNRLKALKNAAEKLKVQTLIIHCNAAITMAAERLRSPKTPRIKSRRIRSSGKGTMMAKTPKLQRKTSSKTRDIAEGNDASGITGNSNDQTENEVDADDITGTPSDDEDAVEPMDDMDHSYSMNLKSSPPSPIQGTGGDTHAFENLPTSKKITEAAIFKGIRTENINECPLTTTSKKSKIKIVKLEKNESPLYSANADGSIIEWSIEGTSMDNQNISNKDSTLSPKIPNMKYEKPPVDNGGFTYSYIKGQSDLRLCEHCNCFFSGSKGLLKHKKLVAEKPEMYTPEKRPAMYKCSHCQYFFSNSKILVRHLDELGLDPEDVHIERSKLTSNIAQNEMLKMNETDNGQTEEAAAVDPISAETASPSSDKNADSIANENPESEAGTSREKHDSGSTETAEVNTSLLLGERSAVVGARGHRFVSEVIIPANSERVIHVEKHLDVKVVKEPSVVRCDHCGNIFANKSSLAKHKRLVAQNPTSHRLLGRKKFSYSEFREKQKAKARLRKQKKYTCDQCGEELVGWRRFTTHKRIVHTRTFVCEFCDKAFGDRGQLSQHVQRHKGERNILCSQCDYRSVSNQEMKHHEEKYHGNLELLCTHCPAVLPSYQTLRAHERTHKQGKYQPVYCDHCPWVGNTKHALKLHATKEHFPERQTLYQCHFCDKVFNQKGKINRHLIQKHDSDPLPRISNTLADRTKIKSEVVGNANGILSKRNEDIILEEVVDGSELPAEIFSQQYKNQVQTTASPSRMHLRSSGRTDESEAAIMYISQSGDLVIQHS